MSHAMFVTGLLLLALTGAAALLGNERVLKPGRSIQCLAGLAAAIVAVTLSTLDWDGDASTLIVLQAALTTSASFLFGPLAGAVTAALTLSAQSIDSIHGGGVAAGAAAWAAGSLCWWLHGRSRASFWWLLLVLTLLTPIAVAPWMTTQDPTAWRCALITLVLGAGVGVLRSRAHAQQRMHLRECELMQALNAPGGGRWEWDLRQRRFFYHGRIYHQFGLKDSPEDDAPTAPVAVKDDATWQALLARVHPQDLKLFLPALEHSLDIAGQTFQTEFRVSDTHGNWHWMRARGNALERDSAGRTLRAGGLLLDATQQHDLADALRLSQDKYTTFYETLPDAAGIMRIHDGRMMDVNPTLERLLRTSAREIIGKTPEELKVQLPGDDLRRFLSALTSQGFVQGMPVEVLLGDTTIPGLLSARRTNIAGENCMVFVYHDMTQARRIQESLQASSQLLQQASRLARIGAWESEPGQGVTYWSDVCCEIHGLEPGTRVPRRHYIERFVAPAWRPMVREASRLHGSVEKTWNLEFEIIRADGRQVWVRVRSETVLKDGKLHKIRGVLQDIDEFRRTSERMHASEARFEHIFQALPIPLCFVRRDDGRFVDVNPAWEQALGFTRIESLGRTLVDLGIYTAEKRQQLVSAADRAGMLLTHEHELRSRSGQILTVLQSMSPIEVAGQACWLLSVLDITERKRQERKVREREELLSLTISAADIGLWDWDLTTGILRGDGRWHAMLGRAPRADSLALGEAWDINLSGDQRELIEAALRQHIEHPDTPFDATWRIAPPQEPTRWLRNVGKVVAFDPNNRPLRMLGVTMDVTLQHEQQELLHHMTHYDALTALPNRVLLAQRLRTAVAQAEQSARHLAVVFIDLDALKAINDAFGHEAGDRLLVLVAGRLRRALRPDDCVARLGGDEFAVLLGNLTDRESCERRLRSLIEAAGAPYQLNGKRVTVTASVGYTLFPEDSADTDTLLRHADQAMYVAKQAGGNRLRAFDSVQETARQGLMEQRERFQQAMNNGELTLYLQPKVNMRTGQVVGAEALTRWVHPVKGVLLPGSFLHLLDGAELDGRFAQWVLESALALTDELKRKGIELQISVNILAEQLRDRGFADWVLKTLDKFPEVRPRQLDLEITETAALYDVEHAAGELTQLRNIGVSVSLDDFGTGYSSLAYLRRLPIDQVKLDQSYVRGMVNDAGDLAIVQGVIGLARSFGYRIVAEGVETQEHGELLVRMGCMFGQGHGISAPMPAADLAQWMQQWHAPESWLQAARTLPESLPLI